MFEFSKTQNYVDIVNLVAKSDNLDAIQKDYINSFLRKFAAFIVKALLPKKQYNQFKRDYLFQQRMAKSLRRSCKNSLLRRK